MRIIIEVSEEAGVRIEHAAAAGSGAPEAGRTQDGGQPSLELYQALGVLPTAGAGAAAPGRLVGALPEAQDGGQARPKSVPATPSGQRPAAAGQDGGAAPAPGNARLGTFSTAG